MSGRQASTEEIASFREHGFVVVRDLLAADELDHFTPLVDAAVAKRQAGDRRSLAEKSRYERSFQQCMNLWEDCPEVRPLSFHPRVAECAARLLGVSALRLWHDQALYKEVGGRETDPHQDHPYWPIAESNNITAWIPLDGSSLEAGAMGYVPGSHRFGVSRFVNIFGQKPPYDLLAGPEARGIAPVFVEVPRGGVAFHHGRTIHLARANQSPRVRRVHTMIFFADGSTRGSEFPHFSVDRAGIAVGERIASDATPLAWPRPSAELPEPPGDRPFFLRPR